MTGKRKRRRLYEEEVQPATAAEEELTADEPSPADDEESPAGAEVAPSVQAPAPQVPAPKAAIEPAREATPIRELEPARRERGVIEGYVVVKSRARGGRESAESVVEELATVYEVSYDEDRVRSILADMFGSGAMTMGRLGLMPFRFVPVFGKMVRQAVEPAMERAVTYAVSQVFETHFERGGNLQDLSVDRLRERFRKSLAEGRKIFLPQTAS